MANTRNRGRKFLLRGWIALAVVRCATPDVPLWAQGQFTGPEMQVNSFTGSTSQTPRGVAVDSQGRTIVVWTSELSPGDDQDGNSVQARRFAASGAPLGPQFQVNVATPGFQSGEGVVVLPDDSFVVVWGDSTSTAADPAGGIQARRFDADGAPTGGQFRVNSYTPEMQSLPAVAADASGRFVVVWQSNGSSGNDPDASIQGRLFDSAALPIGVDFQINSTTSGDQRVPRIGRSPSGAFVATWDDELTVRARRFDVNGAPLAPDFVVTSDPFAEGYRPVAAANDDGFVVSWYAYASSGDDQEDLSVQARFFDAAGAPRGKELLVNQTTTGNQDEPNVAATPDGGFFVTWASDSSNGNDTEERSIQGRGYGSDGHPTSAEFQINSYTPSYQFRPIVAPVEGDYLVSWLSFGSFGEDGGESSIQLRRLKPALFADGFETGDVESWSVVALAVASWRPNRIDP